MKDWLDIEIESLADKSLPNSFVDGDWIEAEFITNEGIRIIQTGNVGIGKYLDKADSKKFISLNSFQKLKCKKVFPGDILICRLAEPIGRCCMVPCGEEYYVTAVDVVILRPSEKYSKGFLLYYLNQDTVLKLAIDKSGGSTRQRISRKNYGKLKIHIPKSKSEQTQIAQILSTTDKAIEQTEKLIAKYQLIKTGLMQDLLTKGIDANGNIRSRETHAFVVKNGIEVPEEWEVKELEKITTLITKGESPNWQGFKYQTEGVLFVTSENVRDGFLDIKSNEKYIPLVFHNKLQRSQLRKGDILINLVGASIGRSALYNLIDCANINQAVSLIRLVDTIYKSWFAYYLNFPVNVHRLLGEQVETARANLSLTDLRGFFVAVPSMEEQEKIAGKLTGIQNIIDSCNQKLSKLQSLKTGLMQDLLSGKVRVKVGEKEMA